MAKWLVKIILAGAVVFPAPHLYADAVQQEFQLNSKYLNFPVKNGAPKKWVSLSIDGEKVREFDIELSPDEPDFWVYLEVGEFSGKTGLLRVEGVEESETSILQAIHQGDSFPGEDEAYKEGLRPQFHFTSKRGWNNDPNGMVYYDGEYHLFYQHNPFGWKWGNMTWGHAVSKDLIHWKELGDAIHPDRLGTIFSGSAAVDENNSTGLQEGDEKVLIAAYTSAGGNGPWSEGQPFTQSIAYSNDRGRTWTKYEENPVQGHLSGSNRDPKIFWHDPIGKWVIVLYLDENVIGVFNSVDLKTWEKTGELKSFHECPELFELPVDGNKSDKKWVLYGGSGDYMVGDFDGREFHPETEAIKFSYGNCFYASQTFNNIPEEDGRRIQIGWGRGDIPGMPFNQMMNFPTVLTLHSTEEGPRVFVHPVEEISKIRGVTQHDGVMLNDSTTDLESFEEPLLDIELVAEIESAKEVGLAIGSAELVYDTIQKKIRFKDQEAPLDAIDGKIELRILIDRTSVEIYANGGRVYMPVHHIPQDKDYRLSLFTRGGSAHLETAVGELKSIWN
ncbi:MAG: GH32 C-terminal domain-containing protein [Candidatus Omnitrophica bacterium]|nr:GH32 C-terminal domain-containing protein [Candidatus Omnitrophota bacterium]